MAKKQKTPDLWQVSFKHSIYEDLMNGTSYVLSFDKEKNKITVMPIKLNPTGATLLEIDS